MPGEITLAHRGVLFLDEINEFDRNVLEALRQPMEDGKVSIFRGRGGATFPSKFVLVASSNPCPCGYFGDTAKVCKCSPKRIEQYQNKLSGPILDRIDLHVRVRPVEKEKLRDFATQNFSHSENNQIENLSKFKANIFEARRIQTERFLNTEICTNSEMGNMLVSKFCKLDRQVLDLLSLAQEKFKFSARTFFKLIKISRTIADLDLSVAIKTEHMAEAIQYRLGT